MNVEADDRLSSLPDELIQKIISFVSIKQAMGMSTLSSRWRFIWTSLPYLNFSLNEFSSLTKFSEFVTHVLSSRNTQIEASSVKLRFHGKLNQVFVKNILEYAFSHNVQQMIVLRDCTRWDEFTLSLFISQSLKHLTIVGLYNNYINVSSTWELPALTTLYLKNIVFHNGITDKYIGIFSKCPNLKNLTLNHCSVLGGSDVVEIYHPGLVNLKLENGNFDFNDLNVVTPHLKNLIIREWSRVHVVSAPELASLRFKGSNDLQISQNSLCSLETVDLCIDIDNTNKTQKSNETDAHKIVGVLQRLHNVKFLTLNLEIIQVLSTFVALISHQPSPFENLKSLKIYPHNASLETIPIEVRNYLLDGSSGAIFTRTRPTLQDIIALKNVISAQKHMAKLQWLLEKEKTKTETNMYQANAPMDDRHVEKKNVEIQLVAKMKMQIVRMVSMIKSCWRYIGRTTSM